MDALHRLAVKPDWILTDDMLGAGLSGLDVARTALRDFGVGRACLITGNTEPARLEELRQSSLPVIVKPATPEHLITLLGVKTNPKLPATAA
jgi:hypothetical protein